MRLFYGLSLPDNVRRCAADHAQVLSSQFPGRYVLPENYHITLAFLGDVPEDRAADACDILRQYTINMPSPLLTLGETGFFGNRERAIVTIRIQDTPPLLPLHQSLVHALDNAGLPADHAGQKSIPSAASASALSGSIFPRAACSSLSQCQKHRKCPDIHTHFHSAVQSLMPIAIPFLCFIYIFRFHSSFLKSS